jgi:hypothetical protein
MSPRISVEQFEALHRGKPLPRPESDVVAAILAYLATVRGVIAWRQNTGAVAVAATERTRRRFIRFGVKGLPDILGFRAPDARTIGIEVKRPTEQRVRREQELFLARLAAAGGIALVARSVDDVAAVIH